MNDNELNKELTEALIELAGLPLPNSFDEMFARQLARSLSPGDALIAAGILHTPGYQDRAEKLAKRPDIMKRVAKYDQARSLLAIQYGPALRDRNSPL